MRDLPSGTVSMLFSDIEGSTLLLGRLGPRYLEVLDDHRRLLREVWARNGGAEIGTEGDSFFVVFTTAGEAVAAAAQGQLALQHHRWPADARLRVRMGIHTGSPQRHGDDYWGMDVHRAARVAAAAHGGQVVMSAVTAVLARDGLPDGLSLRDLGSHRLKDIPEPEHLYQLSLPGLPEEFPPLRTVGTATSLPAPATPLLGRDAELADLTSMLPSPPVRLVTLTGPGGSGKTRLALAAAAQLLTRFPDGVFHVPLASVVDAEVMWTSVAEAVDVPARERTPSRIAAYLAHRCLLLVLDNLEQLAGADGVVSQLLEAAPDLTILATSRRPLGLAAEQRLPVAPLSLPDTATLGDAVESGAVQLFVQRARAVRPAFRLTDDNVAEVVALCRRLDGLPLAIELCAARVRVLSTRALLARIDEVLDIPSTSSLAPGRQRTLRAAISWSCRLLSSHDRRVFLRLAVFSGGADLDAVAAVACREAHDEASSSDALETVAELADASLVTLTEAPDGSTRVALLETIGRYAAEELRESGEDLVVRGVHASYYAGLAERLQTMRESMHKTALDHAEADLDNFRAALDWAVPSEDEGDVRDLDAGVRLCAALGWVWLLGGYVAEGRRWHERVVARADVARAERMPSWHLHACVRGLANLVLVQGEPERAHELATRSLSMAREIGDEPGVAFALSLIGSAQMQLGRVEEARDTLEEALARHRGLADKGRLARVLGNLGGAEEELGRLDRAEALMRESLAIYQGLGDVHDGAIQGQNLAYLLAVADRLAEADELAVRLVETILRLGSPSLTMAFAHTVMNILVREGDAAGAAHLFGAEEAMGERLEMTNPLVDEELEEALALVGEDLTREEWERHRALGRGERVEDLLSDFAGRAATT